MKITYLISEADFLEAQKAFRKSAGPMFASWRRNFQIVGLAVMTSAALLILVLRPERKTFSDLLPFFVFVGVFWAVLFVFPNLQSKRLYARNPRVRDELTVEIYEDHLVLDATNSHAELKWEAFTGYLETKNLFLLFQSPGVFNPLPKRAFGAGEAEQFSILVARKLPKKKREASVG